MIPAERFGNARRERCTTCAHFRRGTPPLDSVEQCTNPDAPLYRASEDMAFAIACALYERREA